MDNANLPDYFTNPLGSFPSFHLRTGERRLPDRDRRANTSGYPVPGIQSPTAASVMTKDYFASDETWSNILDHGRFDYIVIGSGCTALAFIDKTLELDPHKRILVLERGDFWLPSHFQNLPLPFKLVLGGPSETFPWTLSRKTFRTRELVYCHGSCPFFGGRSTFWSAWCPQPETDLMHIGDTIFDRLQHAIDENLRNNIGQIPSAQFTESARLAVGRRSPTSTLSSNKWSVPGPLLGLIERQRNLTGDDGQDGAPLEVMLNCTVNKMIPDSDGIVRIIDTNRGQLSWVDDQTKIILCGGTIPNTTLLLNSFQQARETAGHRLSHIVARCPIGNVPNFTRDQVNDKLEIGASYLAGRDPVTDKQYHSQITAIYSPHPESDAEDAARECPDYAAAATIEQLRNSENYVVFVCATLGEFTEDNTNNFVRLNDTGDPSCNVTLQFTLDENDRRLWDTMDKATYDAITAMTDGQNIEYWDEQRSGWFTDRPAVDSIRVNGVVHEASTAFVGEKGKGGSLDECYRPHRVNNVFMTGGAIFPTAGSWNPTLTMCGFAQDLAKKLHNGEPAYTYGEKLSQAAPVE